MFLSELPKLFDRNFAVGYILPAAVLLAATYLLLAMSDMSDIISLLSTKNEWLDGAVVVLIAWLIAVFLLVTNWSLYRLLEGYGRFNPARLFLWKEKRRYHKIVGSKLALEQAYLDSEDKAQWQKDKPLRNIYWRQEVEQFPKEQFLLPTRFGNVIRAFETYSHDVYGLDAIPGWPRLQAVLPAGYSTLVNDSKAQTDFWVNLWAVSLFVAIECVVLAPHAGLSTLWFIPGALLIAFFSSWRARTAAGLWGNYVKAAFDVFLPDLGNKLGFPPAVTRIEARELWRLFGRITLYRDERDVSDLDKKLGNLYEKTDLVGAAGELAQQLVASRPEIARLMRGTSKNAGSTGEDRGAT